ncbi:hypothetical protein DGM93_07520 [Xanthomonas phaseoli pv. phaseoli]|nr:hypothetical protein DGM93_07520 [Xanthomonas phaseoli pv. phaseoli]
MASGVADAVWRSARRSVALPIRERWAGPFFLPSRGVDRLGQVAWVDQYRVVSRGNPPPISRRQKWNFLVSFLEEVP